MCYNKIWGNKSRYLKKFWIRSKILYFQGDVTGLLDSTDISSALLIFVELFSVLSFQFRRFSKTLYLWLQTALLLFVFPFPEAGVWEWTGHLLWCIYWRINLGNSQSFRVIFNDGNDSRRKKNIADYICPECCRCVMPFIRMIQVFLGFPLQLEDFPSLNWTLSLVWVNT